MPDLIWRKDGDPYRRAGCRYLSLSVEVISMRRLRPIDVPLALSGPVALAIL
jgi:hypothetical protein